VQPKVTASRMTDTSFRIENYPPITALMYFITSIFFCQEIFLDFWLKKAGGLLPPAYGLFIEDPRFSEFSQG
jgi:hypothetical protein